MVVGCPVGQSRQAQAQSPRPLLRGIQQSISGPDQYLPRFGQFYPPFVLF